MGYKIHLASDEFGAPYCGAKKPWTGIQQITKEPSEVTCWTCRKAIEHGRQLRLSRRTSPTQVVEANSAVPATDMPFKTPISPAIERGDAFRTEAHKHDARVVRVKEVIRALDVILFKALCVRCSSHTLVGADSTEFNCLVCGHENHCAGFDLEGCGRRNLVAWGKGNVRRYPNKATIRTLVKMQEGYCAYCDLEMTNYHVEHITPISFGGSNKINNLVLSCPRCNSLAGAKVFPSFLAKKNFIVSQLRAEGQKSKHKEIER